MTGLDKITARIEADAIAEAALTAQKSREECDALRAELEKQAQQLYWDRVREGVKAAEDRVQRLGKAADMEARKTILIYKQQAVADVFDKAEQKLLSMSASEYVAFLAGQAARAAVTGRETLVLNAADAKRYGDRVVVAANKKLSKQGRTAELTLDEQTGDFAGGVIVRSGSISVNCTVDALMEQARAELSAEVAQMLFA